MEATFAQADEAILLNQQDQVTEGTTDNIFIVKNNVLYTPPVSDGALAGVTRALVLELAEILGIQNATRSLAVYDLYTTDECFLTGTAAEVIPVHSVDGRDLQYYPGPVYKQLQLAFQNCIQQATQSTIQTDYRVVRQNDRSRYFRRKRLHGR